MWEFIKQVFADITAEGLLRSFTVAGVVAVALAIWEWFLGRSPLEILLLFALVTLAYVVIAAVIARTRAKKRKQGGLIFFPTRTDLDQHQSLDGRLETAKHVDALLVGGRKLFATSAEYAEKLDRVILPHPGSESVEYYSTVLPDLNDLAKTIRDATKEIQGKSKEVVWSQYLINFSMLLVDTDKNNGWAHLEFVLPNSFPNQRPSLTIYREDYEDVVQNLQKAFNKLWDQSSEPEEE